MTGKLMEIVSHIFKGEQKYKPDQEEFVYDETAPAIEDQLAELAKEVPQEEWDLLPDDLSENLDHYLYGFPKK